MGTNPPDVEAELDKMFWKPPAVSDPSALVNPFFSSKPLPHNFSKHYVPYVLSAFTQLSQLTHEVAVNAPIQGSSANPVLRSFLVFHVERIIDAGFNDPTFMRSLRPTKASDHDAADRLAMLRTASAEFSTRWHTAMLAEQKHESLRVIKQCWAAAKSAADVISTQTLSFENAESRVELALPWWRVADIFTTEGRFPTRLVILWLWWGALVALALDVFVWVIWHSPNLWMPIVATVVCTTGFGGFLVFFYTLTRRNTVASWFANMLSRHLALEYYTQREGRASRVGEQDLEFYIGSKKTNHPRKLTLSPSVINHQVIMIGITNAKQLRICSWNFSARLATNIRWEDAIGKSLEAMIDPDSIPVVQTMFNELKLRGKSSQHRLLFNSVRKGKVPIRATATIACVDGSPIGMIVGTVIEEEERAVMSYFSRTGASALLDHLREVHHVDNTTTTDLVMANSFELLKERTTSAIRNWRATEKEELIDLLENPTAGGVRAKVHCADNVPGTFQCDYMQTERILSDVFNGIQNVSLDRTVSVSLSFRETSIDHFGGGGVVMMLQVLIETELPCSIPPGLKTSLQESLRNVGYLVEMTEFSVRMQFPVTPSAITASGGYAESLSHGSPTFVSPCTFLIYEPDSVYLSHLTNYCARQQHRCFQVPNVVELEKLFDQLGTEVSAVILASGSPCFDAMLKVCRQYNSFVVVTAAAHSSQGLFANVFGGPPRQSTDIHYNLNKPVQESEWYRFLNYLRDYRKHQNALQAPTSHECKIMKNISSSESSSVDVVRDIVTGGVMARKTIYLSHDSTSALVMNEVDILRHISGSPYVIRYISSSSPSRREICLFFQYCKYGTLIHAAREQPKGFFDARQVALFARQLLYALKYIHSKGVAHRDVKPQNVVLSSPDHLQLADFGSATRDPSMAGSVRGGTFRYMAPERIVVVASPADADTSSAVVEVFSTDGSSSAAARDNVSMKPLFAEDLWSAGLTLLDVAGAYPSALEGLRTGSDYLNVYSRYRDEKKSIEIQLPRDFGTNGVSRDDAVDFFHQLLRFNPLERTPASQLLAHRFLETVTWGSANFEDSDLFTMQEEFLPANVLSTQRFHPQNSCCSVFTIGDDDDGDDPYNDDL